MTRGPQVDGPMLARGGSGWLAWLVTVDHLKVRGCQVKVLWDMALGGRKDQTN